MKIRLTVIVMGLLLGTACVPRSTDANEVGVRFCKFMCFGKKTEVISPGRTVFMMPLVNDWYTLDISMQDFYMTRDPDSGDRKRRDDLLLDVPGAATNMCHNKLRFSEVELPGQHHVLTDVVPLTGLKEK
ncbi:MAG: hypothetical protein AAFX94_07230, partial [Myxococcota bacterium]